MMRAISCPSCSAPIAESDLFCEACGARVANPGADERAHAEINLGLVAGVTDRGLHHPRNEDALFVSRADASAVVVVCDGVSSSPEPHTAAQVAADAAGRILVDALEGALDSNWDPAAATVDAIQSAQRAVEEVAATSEVPDDTPACTLVSALWDGYELTVGSIGDSRAYWIGDDDVRRLTVDDALGGSHTLTRWLGADAPPGPPDITRFIPRAPGRVVVCSDGLWNYASDADDFAALVEPAGPTTSIGLAQRLTRAALAAGGHDNVTVGVMTIDTARSQEES